MHMVPQAPKPGDLKALISIIELIPKGDRQQSASTVLVTQHGRGLPCAGFAGNEIPCMQYRVVTGYLKKICNFIV